MSGQEQFAALVGEWSGEKRLWLHPGAPVSESPSTAAVSLAANGRYAAIRYRWAYEDQPQEGLMVVRLAAEPSEADIYWVDSWHMADVPMLCRLEPGGKGLVSARGSYTPPTGPEWGWRIEIHADAADSLRIIMYIITPDGEEGLAVQADYVRQPA